MDFSDDFNEGEDGKVTENANIVFPFPDNFVCFVVEVVRIMR